MAKCQNLLKPASSQMTRPFMKPVWSARIPSSPGQEPISSPSYCMYVGRLSSSQHSLPSSICLSRIESPP